MKKKILVSTDEICGVANLTRPRLLQLADAGHFQKPMRGKWDLLATVAGLLIYYQDRLEARKDTEGYVKARELKAQHDEQLAKLKLGEKQKTLLPKDVVIKIWTDHVIAARTVFMQSPLTPKEREKILAELEILPSEYAKDP